MHQYRSEQQKKADSTKYCDAMNSSLDTESDGFKAVLAIFEVD